LAELSSFIPIEDLNIAGTLHEKYEPEAYNQLMS